MVDVMNVIERIKCLSFRISLCGRLFYNTATQ